MSWLFSRALVEAFSEASSSVGARSALSSGNPTPRAFLPQDRMTAFSRPSRFGMTFGPLTEDLGAELLTWFLADSRARTSALPERETGLTESEAGSGPKWRGSLAKYDPDLRSWKTAQRSLLGDSEEFSETWPRWGTTVAGELFLLPTLVQSTEGSGYGLLPTPTATDYKSEGMSDSLVERRMGESCRGVRLTEWLHRQQLPTPNAGSKNWAGTLQEWGGSGNQFRGTEVGRLKVNPSWVEELMGWVVGWTDLRPLGTDKSPSAPPLPGDC